MRQGRDWGVFEMRNGGQGAWSSESRREEGRGLRGGGGGQLHAALWETWGITRGSGAGSVMEKFYQDLTRCPVGVV